MQSFADDTQIYISCLIDQLYNTISLINSELLRTFNYCRENDLAINTSKTKAIIFTRPNTILPQLPPIIIDNKIVEVADKCTNLGIRMNNHLIWDDHVAHINREVYSTLRTLSIHRQSLSIEIKTNLVQSLLMPNFVYGNIIFFKNELWNRTSP